MAGSSLSLAALEVIFIGRRLQGESAVSGKEFGTKIQRPIRFSGRYSYGSELISCLQATPRTVTGRHADDLLKVWMRLVFDQEEAGRTTFAYFTEV